MARDRRLLQQAIQTAQPSLAGSVLGGRQAVQDLGTAQSISRLALDPGAFGGGRAGFSGLAAQLATAGIGAFAQNRARKELAAQELASQEAFAVAAPELAGVAGQLTPESRENIMLRRALLSTERQFAAPAAAQSAIGKIQADVSAGLISPEQGQLAIQKATTTKPLVEVKTGELETQFQKERGKGKAARLQGLVEAGDRATAFDINLDQIEKALNEGAFIGPGATKVATINEVAAAFGLPADLEKAANTRTIQQRLGDLTLQATGKLKGAISEKELKLAQSTIFDIGTSEAATRKAIETLRTLTSYDQQLSDLASRLEGEGRFTTDFRREKKAFDKQFRENLVDQIEAPISAPIAQPAVGLQEGATATNPTTGEKAVFRGGRWQILP